MGSGRRALVSKVGVSTAIWMGRTLHSRFHSAPDQVKWPTESRDSTL